MILNLIIYLRRYKMSERCSAWRGFEGGTWEKEVNVRSFIKHNYEPYDGDEAFLEGPTADTLELWDQVLDLSRQEREKGGVLDMDTKVISTITSHGAGYLNNNVKLTKKILLTMTYHI
jgi:formate C-acetyltransferase